MKRLLDRHLARGGRIEQLAGRKLAAIGPGTATEMRRYGLKADVVPAEYRAESLAVALGPYAAGSRFLLRGLAAAATCCWSNCGPPVESSIRLSSIRARTWKAPIRRLPHRLRQVGSTG